MKYRPPPLPPGPPGAVGDADAAALCRRGEARKRTPEEENAAAERVRPGRPLCSEERPVPSVMACRSLMAAAAWQESYEWNIEEAAHCWPPAGDTSGQRGRPAGTAAAPAASGFLLRSGLSVAGPRTPVAYCFSTSQCAPHGGRGVTSFIPGAIAGVGQAT